MKCSSGTVCERCEDGFYLENDNCVVDCVDGSFGLNGVCVDCDASCSTCSVADDICFPTIS